MSKSTEIKSTDGRKNNSRKKPIPVLPTPKLEKSNKPALNKAKKKRTKIYATKAIKNIFGSETQAFEVLAKHAEKGSYNHIKLLFDYAYGGDKDDSKNTYKKAPIINFFGDSVEGQAVKKKIIDVTPKEDN